MTSSPYITGGNDGSYDGGVSVKFDSDVERLIFAFIVLVIIYLIYKYFICNCYPIARINPLMIIR
jgi:hypothetical protein